ncbi:MAG TPA: c-type cytochrome, partial [Gemmataceae bacterium]|nr:c-type cytochrome [Gemmataceae bacterium]
MGPRLAVLTGVLCLLCATPNNGPRQQPGGNKKTAQAAGYSTKETGKQPGGGATADRNALRQAALLHAGDPKRGKAIYLSAAAQCATCHKVDGQGGEVGPDLSQIGGKFDRTHLIESILVPSAEIPQGYHATVIETRSGRIVTG